ncbi:unnamed protein product, partial [marine sediment metagenome]
IIDDGFHSEESILTTFKSVYPFLSNEFIYIIEDNEDIHKKLKSLYPNFSYDYSNQLTIVTPN